MYACIQRVMRMLCIASLALWIGGARSAESPPVRSNLTSLQSNEQSYQTPLAGQGFHAELFGKVIDVPPQNIRSITAWDLGLSASFGLSERVLEPLGSIYIWRHSDDRHLTRAILSGLYDEVFYAASPRGAGHYEGILTFENFTVPFAQRELIDGEALRREELKWGYARAGAGIGYREQVNPGAQDNMRALSLTVEPGYLYFGRGKNTASDFSAPRSTLETRLHMQGRWDAMKRNILQLPHQGFATGTDIVAAHRSRWDDWGRNDRERGGSHQDYTLASAYASTAGGLPGIGSDRHRLLGSVHAGVGRHVDRFSAPRVDGGPEDSEYQAIARPVLPGASFGEFFPTHYVIAGGEYRYEPVFFTYVGLRGSVAWLDRDRLTADSKTNFHRKEDVLTSVGIRVTTGFLAGSRLQLESNYNAELARDNRLGGYNVLSHLSRDF